MLEAALGKLARRLLPAGWVRVLRRRALLLRYCREIAEDVEKVTELTARQDMLDGEYWAAMLRKYSHIIDKSLRRADFEPGHSSVFHGLALEALVHLESPAPFDDPSVAWARGILEEHQRAQNGEPPADSPSRASGAFSTSNDGAEESEPGVTYERLLVLMRSRRSNRSYSELQVDHDAIRKLVEAASWAPSSCNRQTVKMFTTNNPLLATACLAACKGGTCFKGDSAPCFLAFCADLRPYVLPAEMWLPMVDASLAAQNCCLAAHALGLGVTLLTWCQHDDAEERELRARLQIPRYYRIVVNAAVGYPDRRTGTPLRKALASTYSLRS